MEENYCPIQAYNKKELAALYGISVQTIYKWLKKINNLSQPVGKYYNPAQIKIIFDHCGHPTLNPKK